MAQTPPRRCLVAGATGLIGSHLVTILLETGSEVTALVRKPGAIEAHQFVVSYDALKETTIPPCDAGFCALGTTIKIAGSQEAFRRVDYEYVVAFAEVCARSGAKCFCVVSSVGADPMSGNFYLRTKGQMEEAVKALPFESCHIFRPSFLVGNREERRPGEAAGIFLGKIIAPLLVGPLRRYRPVQAVDVARAMAAACSLPAGRYLHEFDSIRSLAAL